MAHLKHRSREEEADATGEKWDRVLISCGVDKQLRPTILNEDFDDIRRTGSAEYWFPDSAERRCRALKNVYELSCQRSRRL